MAQALARNQDLAIARQRLLQARASVTSRQPPGAEAGAEASASRSSTALRYPPGLGETRPIDWHWMPAGRSTCSVVAAALEAADAQAQAEEEEGRALRVSLLAELASSYVALRSAQERQRIALDTVASLETARRLAQTRYERAWARPWRRPGARGLELGQARLPALREEQARLAHAIGVLTGGFPGELKDALAQGPARMPSRRLPSGLPSEMLRNRPDIRASGPAGRRHGAVGVAVAERFPRFVIPLDLGSAASLVSDLFSRASVAWSVGAGASQSLYNGGRAEGTARGAGRRPGAWPMNTACGGPSRTWRTRWPANAERERQAHLSAAVRDSLAAQDRATRLYRSGLIGYLPVLAAQQPPRAR